MFSQGQSITSSIAGKKKSETFLTLEGLYSKNPHMAELMTSPTTGTLNDLLILKDKSVSTP